MQDDSQPSKYSIPTFLREDVDVPELSSSDHNDSQEEEEEGENFGESPSHLPPLVEIAEEEAED